MWAADGKSIVFVRRPGLPFGQQAQQGTGAMGVPHGPAFQAPGAAAGRGGRAGAAAGAAASARRPSRSRRA